MTGYETRLVLGDYLPGVNQPQFSVERTANEFATGAKAVLENTVLISGIGLQLKSYQSTPEEIDESSDGQSGVLSVAAGTASVASDVVERLRSGGRDPIAAFAPLSPWIKKAVGAALPWTNFLPGGPPIPGGDADVQWIMKSSATHPPHASFTLRFFVPGDTAKSGGVFAVFAFPGPAGQVDGQAAGSGLYALAFKLNGVFDLYELLTDDNLIMRQSFKFAEPDAVNGKAHFVTINSDTITSAPYTGTRIVFTPLGAVDPSNAVESVIQAAIIRVNAMRSGVGKTYHVPKPKSGTRPPSAPFEVRFGARNTIRVAAQVSVQKYRPSGHCFTDDIGLPFPLAGNQRVRVSAYGQVPAGTTVQVRLFNAETNTELSGRSVEWATGAGQQVTYDSLTDLKRVYAKVEMTSNMSQNLTPTIKSIEIWRNGQESTPEGEPIIVPFQGSGELVSRTVTRWEWDGPTRDLSGESCRLEVNDMSGDLAARFVQGRIPARIEVRHTATGTTWSPVWCGYVTAKGGRIIAGAGTDSPAMSYSLFGEGEWTRLDRAKFFDLKTWFELDSPTEPRPWKVTEAIKYCLYMAYPASMVNIPDRDLRIWTVDGSGYVTEPGASAYEVASDLAMSYFGAILIFDPSAGTVGQWRMIEKALSTDPPIVQFECGEQPGTFPHSWVDAWGNLASPISGQTVKRVPFQGLTEDVSAPEGNRVYVIGGVVGTSTADGAMANRLEQELVNTNSYNPKLLPVSDPNAPDPTHPDYLGYPQTIQIVDASLSTQEAVDTIARRVFDIACHAYTTVTLDAPVWLVTVAADADQVRPRPLRVRDRVRVSYRGETRDFLIASVTFGYDSDETPRATYTLVRTSQFATKPEVPRMPSPLSTFMDLTRRATGSAFVQNGGFAGSREVRAIGAGALTNLPPAPADPIQDLDPASPTFGEFTGPAGYV